MVPKMAVTSANDAEEKLDDKMQPLPADQCGSVLKATDEVSVCSCRLL